MKEEKGTVGCRCVAGSHVLARNLSRVREAGTVVLTLITYAVERSLGEEGLGRCR